MQSRWFVVVDDFVGSGGQIRSLFSPPDRVLPRLLDRYPSSIVRILVVVGFESGLQTARELVGDYRDRVEILAAILLNDSDRCFTDSSKIIPDPEQRNEFRRFCTSVAQEKMRGLPSRFWLGYEENGALVVFSDSVPNNSVPILWYGGGSWMPLFPRSGLPE
jgi:hypothetical protein